LEKARVRKEKDGKPGRGISAEEDKEANDEKSAVLEP